MNKALKIIFAFEPLFSNLVFRFIIGVVFGVCGLQFSEYLVVNNYSILSKITGTCTILVVYFLVILSILGLIFDRIYSFHQRNNALNIKNNPLKFSFKYKYKIYFAYKLFFFVFVVWSILIIWLH
ncbi:hypothetical protein AAFN90_20170 [Erwiniaceae bacterium CAU 1747]